MKIQQPEGCENAGKRAENAVNWDREVHSSNGSSGSPWRAKSSQFKVQNCGTAFGVDKG
jgi:hypothetical protein